MEYSILAQLSDAGLETKANLFCGHEFEEQEGGSQVVITCFGGVEMVFNSGNWRLRTRLSIRSAADKPLNETQAPDPREVHRELVQLVREAIFTEAIAAELTAHETDFTCEGVYPAESDSSVDGRYLVTVIDLEIDCIRADFED